LKGSLLMQVTGANNQRLVSVNSVRKNIRNSDSKVNQSLQWVTRQGYSVAVGFPRRGDNPREAKITEVSLEICVCQAQNLEKKIRGKNRRGDSFSWLDLLADSEMEVSSPLLLRSGVAMALD
jgi:hypothetical protein